MAARVLRRGRKIDRHGRHAHPRSNCLWKADCILGRIVASDRACCPNCFEYAWLKEFVERESEGRGTCSYCGSERTPVLLVDELEPYFKNFASMYEPDNGQWGTSGESLVDRA